MSGSNIQWLCVQCCKKDDSKESKETKIRLKLKAKLDVVMAML